MVGVVRDRELPVRLACGGGTLRDDGALVARERLRPHLDREVVDPEVEAAVGGIGHCDLVVAAVEACGRVRVMSCRCDAKDDAAAVGPVRALLILVRDRPRELAEAPVRAWAIGSDGLCVCLPTWRRAEAAAEVAEAVVAAEVAEEAEVAEAEAAEAEVAEEVAEEVAVAAEGVGEVEAEGAAVAVEAPRR